jgi:hypothetical protein
LVVEDQIYAYARQTGAEIVVVVFNNATTPQSVTVPMGSLRLPSQAGWTAVLGEGPVEAKADQLTLSMSGRSVCVLRWTGVWEGKIHTQTGRR